MLITELRLQKKKTHREELKAECSIIFNNCLHVKRINIIERADTNIFLEMPSIKDKEGHFKNVFFPINADTRAIVEKIVFSSYSKLTTQGTNLQKFTLSNSDVKLLGNQTIHDFDCAERNERSTFSNEVYGSISVTAIRLKEVSESNNLVAYASVVLDYCFAMSNMKIIHNSADDRYILCMPVYKNTFNQYTELYHSLNKTFRSAIEKIALGAFFRMKENNANVLRASVMVPKTITEQTLNDFECRYEVISNTITEKNKGGEIQELESLGDGQEELFYNTPSSILKACYGLQKSNIVFGKIVSYTQKDSYSVRLSNGNKGIISCDELDTLCKVVDYQKYILSTYITKSKEETDPILKHIGIEYAFETIGKKDNLTFLLSFARIKYEYLKYLIEKEIIIKGLIIEIDQRHASIEIPFGFVFITTPARLFGYKCDDTFVYADYLNCVVSIILHYDKNQNILYPVIYNNRCGVVSYSNKYIFPYTYTWHNNTKNSKLWLDKPVILEDKHQKHFIKQIGDLFVISNLRYKGEKRNTYKGNIKYIIDEESLAKKVRKNILGVHWLTNLKGHNIHSIIPYLESKGYEWEVSYVYSEKAKKDVVIFMSPDLHQKKILPCNTIISLVVSKGPKKEYVIPDFVGMHINVVKKELRNNNVRFKVRYSDICQDSIPENCILETIPADGSILHHNQSIVLVVYSFIIYSSPFELFETDIIENTTKTVEICSKYAFDSLSSVSWQKDIIMFLIKHQLAVTRDLISWIGLLYSKEIKYNRIISFVNKLQNFGLINVFRISDGIRKLNNNFFVPTKRMFELVKSQLGYEEKNKRFKIESAFCKSRASENIVFLKLVQVLGIDHLVEYKVDWFNPINLIEDIGKVRIHFAVRIKENIQTTIYLIETIRVVDEKILDKLKRYTQMFSHRKPLPIKLILVFPNLECKEEFFEIAPNEIYFNSIQVLSTTDKTVCDDSLTDFDSIFYKENQLCKIIY